MRICLSADMEGISQIVDPREVKAFCDEYWISGRDRMNDDVVAAATGLLEGGAQEVIVLDNHGSGNTFNLMDEALVEGSRLETWNVFDLREKGVNAMLQVGYHARCGERGFMSHTYVGGLRLRAQGELISESHGRAWGSGVPLLGIIGNDEHERTLGSLDGVPYLVVQRTISRDRARPVYGDPEESRMAIRAFAAEAVRNIRHAPLPSPPRNFLFESSMPMGIANAEVMEAASWRRRSATEFEIELSTWEEARKPLAAAMSATVASYRRFFSNGELRTREIFESFDRSVLTSAAASFMDWAHELQADWIASVK